MLHSRSGVIAAFLLFIGGCAATSNDSPTALGSAPSALLHSTPGKPSASPAYATIPVDDTLYDPEIIAWLRSKDVRVEKDPDGDERVFDSPGCRRALVQYRRMLRLRLDVIAQNVLNADTTRDARGERNPYRRRLVADKNGSIEITTDPSPFQKRYDPSHPDADRDGYVLYPNVDKEIERVNGLEASREYDGVTRVLKHFDPTFAGN